jgi:hypothetical protein
MKKLLITLVSVCLTQVLFAQCNEFYPIKENVRYEYDHFDKKEKLTLRTTNAFKNVSGTGNSMKATMVQELIDVKKNSPMGTSESEWICDNGTLHFTMNSMNFMMDNGQQSTMNNPSMTMEVTGDKMDVPSSFQVGQVLKDLTYQVKMTMSGISIMNKTFMVKDRKVEAQESITTPAGTFNCYKISFTTSSEGGLGKGTIKSTMWYAKDAGLVKSENYKEDGKITSRQVLTKIVK